MPRKRKPYIPTVFRQLGLKDPIEEIDLQSLYDILSLMRKSRGKAEEAFITKFLVPTGAKADKFGNYHLNIKKPDGTNSEVLWSAHTDSVHRNDGSQKLYITTSGIIKLADKQPFASCLGADDGAGLWLLLEMIKVKVPGYYLFHREEESGRVGSRWIVDNLDNDDIKKFKYAIAFDRKNFDNVITKQSSSKCCSQAFVDSIAPMFPNLNLKADPTGSYTDTASYTKLISECTNISVGYTGAHTPNETLDIKHLLRLRDSLLYHFDESKLVSERDPTIPEYTSYSYGYGYDDENYGDGYMYRRGQYSQSWYGTGGNYDGVPIKDLLPITRVMSDYPLRVAKMLHDMGFDHDNMMLELFPNLYGGKQESSNVVYIGGKKDDVSQEMEEEAAAALASLREENEKALPFDEEDETGRAHENPVKDVVEH